MRRWLRHVWQVIFSRGALRYLRLKHRRAEERLVAAFTDLEKS